MKNIVKVENNSLTVSIEDIITLSGNKYESVRDQISRNKEKFIELCFSFAEDMTDFKSAVFEDKLKLNEEQTSFLFILMDNSAQIVDFKFNLVKQFYKMKDIVCIANTKQLEAKDKQIKKLSSSVYAKPRGGGLETVTRVIRDYGIKCTPHDLNILLCSAGILSSEDRIVEHFVSSTMSGDVALVHVNTVLRIVDESELERDLGYADNNPSLFEA